MSAPDAPSSEPKSRWRFWIVLTCVVLGPIFVIAGLLWYSGYAAESELQAALADTDQRDPNWRLPQLLEQRPVLDDDKNAALLVLKVKSLSPKNYGAAPAFYELFTSQPFEAQLNTQQLTALEAELKRADAAILEARKLVDLETGRFPITYAPDWISSLTPGIQEAREVARLLMDDVMLHAHNKDTAAAARSLRGIWIVGRSIGDEPTLIAMLVRIAIEAVAVNSLQRLLAQTEPTADELAALQKVMEEDMDQSLWLVGIRGERAGTDMLFENLQSGAVSRQNLLGTGLGLQGGGLTARDTLEMMTPGSLKRQRAQMLRHMNDMVDVARRPPHEWKAALTAIELEARSMPLLVRLLAPANIKVAEADVRRFALLRVAVVGLAAERFRIANQKWPESQDVLVKAGLLKESLLDPYDGKSLRLKRLPDGLIVYSIGPDGQDNNGKRDPNSTITAGTDLTFRLWNPNSRRQPPKPPKPVQPSDAPGGGSVPGLAPPP